MPDPKSVEEKPAGTPRLLPWAWPLICGATVGIGLRLVYSGKAGQPYGAIQSSFALLVPVVVDALTGLVAERSSRRSWAYYFWSAAAANALLILGTFLMLIEGFICVVLALPLFAVLGGVSGVATGALCRWTHWSKPTVYEVAVLPLILGGVEPVTSLPAEVNVVQRSLVIDASADRIWDALMSARHIEVDELNEAWMYRIGVPVPTSADT